MPCTPPGNSNSSPTMQSCKAVDAGDAVADLQNCPDTDFLGLGFIGFQLAFENGGDFFRLDCHVDSSSFHRVAEFAPDNCRSRRSNLPRTLPSITVSPIRTTTPPTSAVSIWRVSRIVLAGQACRP